MRESERAFPGLEKVRPVGEAARCDSSLQGRAGRPVAPDPARDGRRGACADGVTDLVEVPEAAGDGLRHENRGCFPFCRTGAERQGRDRNEERRR